MLSPNPSHPRCRRQNLSPSQNRPHGHRRPSQSPNHLRDRQSFHHPSFHRQNLHPSLNRYVRHGRHQSPTPSPQQPVGYSNGYYSNYYLNQIPNRYPLREPFLLIQKLKHVILRAGVPLPPLRSVKALMKSSDNKNHATP
jgi:hypothetical protein